MKKAKEVTDVSLDLKEDVATFLIHADGSIGNFDSFKLDSRRDWSSTYGNRQPIPQTSDQAKKPFH